MFNRLLCWSQLVHALEQEWATDLIDLLQRRSMAGLSADFGLGAASRACELLTRLGLWDAQRSAAELASYRAYAARFRAGALQSV